MLHPNAEQIRGATAFGTDYRESWTPWRICLHTVEGNASSVEGMRSVARNHRHGPHLWSAYNLRHLIETVPLDKAASALAHPRGTPETNHKRCIQIEQFGYARETQDWGDDYYEWFGEFVIAPICRLVPINLDVVDPAYGAGEGIILATSSSPVRMNAGTWNGCDWITHHQRVPFNDHWDAGKYRMGKLISVVREALGNPGPIAPPLPPAQEDDPLSSDAVIQHLKEHMNVAVADGVAKVTEVLTKQMFGLMSFIQTNQKTAVLIRKTGTPAPWYGLAGGRVYVLDFDAAVEFKRVHEINENSIEVADPLFTTLTSTDVVDVSGKSVDEIVAEVSDTDAGFINGLSDADAQKIAQQVVTLLPNQENAADLLEQVAITLQAMADARR